MADFEQNPESVVPKSVVPESVVPKSVVPEQTSDSKPTSFLYSTNEVSSALSTVIEKNNSQQSQKTILFTNGSQTSGNNVQFTKSEVEDSLSKLEKMKINEKLVKIKVINDHAKIYKENVMAVKDEISNIMGISNTELTELQDRLQAYKDNFSLNFAIPETEKYPALANFYIHIVYLNYYNNVINFSNEISNSKDFISEQEKTNLFDELQNFVKTVGGTILKINDFITSLLLSKTVFEQTRKTFLEKSNGAYQEIMDDELSKLLMPFDKIEGYPYSIYEFIASNKAKLTNAMTEKMERAWVKDKCVLNKYGNFLVNDGNFANLLDPSIEEVFVFYDSTQKMLNFKNENSNSVCLWMQDPEANKWFSEPPQYVCTTIYDSYNNIGQGINDVNSDIVQPFYGRGYSKRIRNPNVILRLFMDVDGSFYLSTVLVNDIREHKKIKMQAYRSGCVDGQPKFSLLFDPVKRLDKFARDAMGNISNITQGAQGFFNGLGTTIFGIKGGKQTKRNKKMTKKGGCGCKNGGSTRKGGKGKRNTRKSSNGKRNTRKC